MMLVSTLHLIAVSTEPGEYTWLLSVQSLMSTLDCCQYRAWWVHLIAVSTEPDEYTWLLSVQSLMSTLGTGVCRQGNQPVCLLCPCRRHTRPASLRWPVCVWTWWGSLCHGLTSHWWPMIATSPSCCASCPSRCCVSQRATASMRCWARAWSPWPSCDWSNPSSLSWTVLASWTHQR